MEGWAQGLQLAQQPQEVPPLSGLSFLPGQ